MLKTFIIPAVLLLTFIVACVETPSGDNDRNFPPLITDNAASMETDISLSSVYRDTIHAIDADGDDLTFLLLSGAAGAYLSDSIVIWKIPADFSGDSVIFSVQVADGRNGYDTIEWPVFPVYAPVFLDTPPDMSDSAFVGTRYIDTLRASVRGSSSIGFSVVSGPAEMTIVDNILRWLPSMNDTGRIDVSVRVANSGGSDTLSWAITVVRGKVVTGRILFPDGKPAAGARILCSTVELSIIPLAGFRDSVLTDKTGTFVIDTLPVGIYAIFSSSSGLAAMTDSIVIGPGVGRWLLPPDTLKEPGSITGTVVLAVGHDPRTVSIAASGIPYYTVCNDMTGAFNFKDLPEGYHDLRFVSTLDRYAALDLQVYVVAGAVIDVGRVALPFAASP